MKINWRILLGLGLSVVLPARTLAQPAIPMLEWAARYQGKTARQIVLEAMAARPTDPWPRGDGHVVLAMPGCVDLRKAYHEPGGSFSPGLGTFGISIWVVDVRGSIRTTSDQIPMGQFKQQWVWQNEREIPGIQTDTPDYQAYWHGSGNGRWLLNLKTQVQDTEVTDLVIRSVGPAGGPVQRLDWDGKRLLVNRRWAVTCDPLPTSVCLGHEGDGNWMSALSSAREWGGADGWGYARLELKGKGEWKIAVQDSLAITTSLWFNRTRAVPVINVPDPTFNACLEAQTAQLLMGVTGWEIRPGDPGQYPYLWMREASAGLVALTEAGYVETARQLARPIAENDLRSGAGSEADGPAVSLWALEEVAARLRDPQFDQWLWPHMRRKAELLWQMREAVGPVIRPVTSPPVAAYARRPGLAVVCEASIDGMIRGRVDSVMPVLYVNAMAYRGFLSASELANRLGYTLEAGSWQGAAVQVRKDWEMALRSAEADGDWAFTRGTWPSWVVSDYREYGRLFEARWQLQNNAEDQPTQTPPQPSHTLSEAHQWLALGQPVKAWNMFRWFVQHQTSPGLYSWWKGSGTDDNYFRWDEVRGWVNPLHITPCYWTAAEMLMLQLDMLVLLDESGPLPVLIIGAGIPREWLNKPMSARGLSTRLGMVDWVWQGFQMHVYVRGLRCPVRLGANFPIQTPIVIH
jgi:hypothetical protein